MRYALMIYSKPAQSQDPQHDPDPGAAAARACELDALVRELGQTGELVDAILGDPALARTVTTGSDGVVRPVDGPAADGTGPLAGYFIIDAEDFDRAVEIASLFPETRGPGGAVEVRPIPDGAQTTVPNAPMSSRGLAAANDASETVPSSPES